MIVHPYSKCKCAVNYLLYVYVDIPKLPFVVMFGLKRILILHQFTLNDNVLVDKRIIASNTVSVHGSRYCV